MSNPQEREDEIHRALANAVNRARRTPEKQRQYELQAALARRFFRELTERQQRTLEEHPIADYLDKPTGLYY